MPSADNPPPPAGAAAATTTTTTTTTIATTPETSRPSQPPITALLAYPLTLFVGSLFSVLSPTAYGSREPSASNNASPLQNHPSPFAPTIASDLHLSSFSAAAAAAKPVNYFARKDNVFNLYFVKIGWIWTTLAFLLLLQTQSAFVNKYRSKSKSTSPSNDTSPSTNHAHAHAAAVAEAHRARRTMQALIRYGLATMVWYLTTQWFFGPAIIDRSFVLTGGNCERAIPQVENPYTATDFGTLVTAVACKSAGGAWRGGHDVSGHVLLLVLMTSLVGFEVWGATRCQPRFEGDDGVRKKEESEGPREKKDEDADTIDGGGLEVWSVRLAWAVVGLGMWMLLMTAIWFHTWFEKLTGLLIALGTVYTIYILPRKVIPWREIVGLPGV
ncbi:putative inositol phospholipid biosynthesis protein Scs3 [Aspergillus homomorphus CBS 101889]|uniref:Acyl-coenzyme A diphosphatase SCS3 n=1 Tax=Aspergillus homomorphus (strain CBS 101889) TaxID=1450537 RepID=A0A395HUJ4_ASPHC|nr:hypothetical protein BO97DRAFT_407429 [Aspergillus homomorphus CBS 101889]RAL09884.1 hypothetical protein BO97DRAFT_407429 [Aspergillus homomorphus CBS 101889]